MGNLVCENISKTYKNKFALEQVNLTIEQGKIYGLIGRNGAGKTTLLSIMTAQNPADSGTVEYDGMPVWENRDALKHLCFSREINTLTTLGPNNMKVKEYLKVASFYYDDWDQKMAEELMEHFHLRGKDKISKLSKGMLSMVTIIIGLASKADITILDEPVAGLDVVAREDFYKLLLEEQERTGRTFIISTHIIEEAADLFEEVIIIDKGKLLLKENTVEFVERCMQVTGLAQDVDAAVEGYHIIKKENMGRSKAVTIMLEEGQKAPKGSNVTIQPLSLQHIFVALCGQEG